MGKDLKEALSSGKKPDLSHCRMAAKVYAARGNMYGTDKYRRDNYMVRLDDIKQEFVRYREYLSAVERHLTACTDALADYLAEDPEMEDIEAMLEAVFCIDMSPGNHKVGPSNLPHICGMLCSGNMAVTIATRAGLLPEDPGMTWERSEDEDE